MHYYQHHIGDFIKNTANLNDHQLATYLRMLWAYYSEEKPFSNDLEDIAFAMRSDEKTVNTILRHYFKETEKGWCHGRCDREISAYHNKKEKAAASANARWNNARNDTNAMRTHNERNANERKIDANQEPITNNQKNTKEKNTKKEIFSPPDWINRSDWDLWIRSRKKMNPEQMQKQVEKLEAWKRDGKDYAGALAQSAVNGWQGLFLPDTKTSLNDERKNAYEQLTGKVRNTERDITPFANRVD